MNPPFPTSYALRRVIFFSLTLVTTLIAMGLLISVYQTDGISPLEVVLLVLYAILLLWICASFWTAMIGFVIRLTRRDRYAISATAGVVPAECATALHTAIVMPVYNEEPSRVFARLSAVYQSLQEIGQLELFDFFILSDTQDPDIWIEEELQWHHLCQSLNGKGRIFYRNRFRNTGRKSGNIADFCSRWGARYRYMIVLDADSLMAGTTLVDMVRLMENNPPVALIQVPPVPVNRVSLFARIMQFASTIYGPLFTTGLNYWQLGEGNYWGHNAILRIQPFADCCGLPDLPGREPFGGKILSHDFVEAALLRRAGWQVWLAYDLGGSYEEIPPTLIDYAKRDRRWCQGNLQHTRLVFARGLHPLSRLHLLMGIMSYLASPLWLLFLVLTGIEAFIQAQDQPVYFFGDSFTPVWPVSYAVEMQTVLVVTLAFLFLPKLLALLLLARDTQLRRSYGGFSRATLSVFLESLFSVLLAPILMLFQAKFVLLILARRAIGWPVQQRDDHQTGVKEACFAHVGQTALGIAIGIGSYLYIPNFFWWFTPVLLGMVLAIPLSIFSSSVKWGQVTQRMGLFLTPQETKPPRVLTLFREAIERTSPSKLLKEHSFFLQALNHPFTHALHTALLPSRTTNRRQRHYLEGLGYQLLDCGPSSLSAAEKRELLAHRETLLRLHVLLWGDLDSEHGAWVPEATKQAL
ncbi:MAG: glucans biosynthesis glucosyltransferase MdoH [Candidatus Competibacteraceae bacterium]|jgi:membrane glycosyltransferase|nr:glucans biosynthesis glucosyltransferase MdoH [Candidatus Competibacteraceae bacterium]